MTSKQKLTLKDRLELKRCLQKGYPIIHLAKNTDFTVYQLTKEIKKGLTDEEANMELWGQYNILKSVKNQILDFIDEDTFNYIIDEEIKERNNAKKRK